MKRFLLIAAIMLVASTCVVTAQQQSPALKPNVSPKTNPAPTRLLLEINYNRTIPPVYAVVNGVEEKPKWIWVTRFVRIPGRESTSPPIQAVRLQSVYNGETADVRVSLLRGSNGFDQEDLVGIFQVGVGEQRIVSELDQFGIEPFTLTLMNTVTPLPPPPDFENRTKSIEVASIESENRPSPGYRIILRNLSEKNVGAVRVHVMSDGMRGVQALWQGEHGQSLIKPGAVVERYLPVMKPVKTATGDYAPGAPYTLTIYLTSVVFEDFSFEGDSEPACLFEKFQVGRKIWLKNVLPLFDQELSKPITDHIEAAKQFKEKFSALRYVVETNELARDSSVGSGCGKPAESASISVENMKLELLRDLEQIITTRPHPPVNFKTWLQERRERYNTWLARL